MLLVGLLFSIFKYCLKCAQAVPAEILMPEEFEKEGRKGGREEGRKGGRKEKNLGVTLQTHLYQRGVFHAQCLGKPPVPVPSEL